MNDKVAAMPIATGDEEFIPFIERASILLLTIGEEAAATILKRLGPKEVQRICSTMASLQDVKREKVARVFQSFISEVSDTTGFGISADGYVRNILTKALGADKAGSIIDRILLGGNTSGLDSLKWMGARSIADVIRQEHPQIQAIVIAYLESELSAEVLAFLPENTRLDIIVRVASLDSVQPDAIMELNNILERQLSGSSTAQKCRMGGHKVAADIMTNLEGGIEAVLMDALSEIDEGLASVIQDQMFVFASLLDVDDRGIQALLCEVPTEQLVVALKGADEALREKIFTNMSKHAAKLMRDDLEVMGPKKLSEVEAAQKEILAIARRMAEAGEIVLAGSSEEILQPPGPVVENEAEVTAERWLLPEFGGDHVVGAGPRRRSGFRGARGPAARAARQSRNLRALTESELESLEQEVREQGFQEGRAAGYEKGYTEAEQAATARVEEVAAVSLAQQKQTLATLLESIAHPMGDCVGQYREVLAELVVSVAAAICERELSADRSAIVAIVSKALDALPFGGENVQIILNPDDLEVLRQMSGFIQPEWQLVPDPQLLAGGCRIETLNSAVDFTRGTRLQQILDEGLAQMLDPAGASAETGDDPAVPDED